MSKICIICLLLASQRTQLALIVQLAHSFVFLDFGHVLEMSRPLSRGFIIGLNTALSASISVFIIVKWLSGEIIWRKNMQCQNLSWDVGTYIGHFQYFLMFYRPNDWLNKWKKNDH